MEQVNFKYYCYVCSKTFQSKIEAASCLDCDSPAIEEVPLGQQQENSEQGRSKFQVYQVRQQTQPQQVLGTLQNVVHPRSQQPSFSSLIRNSVRVVQGPTIEYSFNLSQDSYLFNMMRQLIGDGHTTQRATQEQLNKLEKIEYVKECSICQSVQQLQEEKMQEVQKSEQGSGFKLKCNHTFHQTCIKPWFERANTCPVCRTKLD